VPLPPGISRRQRHHPHGVVINPPQPAKPEPKAYIDLDSDDDE
jgi:hypothetical protein